MFSSMRRRRSLGLIPSARDSASQTGPAPPPAQTINRARPAGNLIETNPLMGKDQGVTYRETAHAGRAQQHAFGPCGDGGKGR